MKKHKIKFSVASNGLEAVNKWKTGGFHLVLMDIQLPVMNGIEATKMIRSIEKEQKIGVLPMSSSFLRHQQEVAAATAESIVNHGETSSSYDQIEEVAAEMLLMSNSDRDNTTPSIFRSPVIIVALTASSLESDRHAALAAGCNDFLTKPVSLEWLEKKIIEWGCMQALIDFEGWRRWKRKSNVDDNNTNVIKKKLASFTCRTPVTTTLTREQLEAEKKRIEQKSKSPNKNGIMLPGVSNLIKQRRFSTAVVQKKRNKILLKPSKSDSDTSTLSRITQSQSDTTANPLLSQSRSVSKQKKFDIESHQKPSTPQSGNKELEH